MRNPLLVSLSQVFHQVDSQRKDLIYVWQAVVYFEIACCVRLSLTWKHCYGVHYLFCQLTVLLLIALPLVIGESLKIEHDIGDTLLKDVTLGLLVDQYCFIFLELAQGNNARD